MNNIAQGRAFALGKNIDTDQIYPGCFVELTDVEDVSKNAMAGMDEDFVKKFKVVDIIAAGTNFGCGSSREHAAITLKGVGVGAVIAEYFGRIFSRNAINLGVPVITCKGITAIVKEENRVLVNIETCEMKNKTTGKTAHAVPMSPYIMNILQSSGIQPIIKAQQKAKNNAVL